MYRSLLFKYKQMATTTARPSTVSQITTADQVAWNVTSAPGGYADKYACGTQQPLEAVPGVGSVYGRKNTGKLLWQGYSTTATGTLTAIQIRVYADKKSRVQDNTIQLTVDGTVVGANLASAIAGNSHLYTAEIPAGITLATVNRLGVITQYQSNTTIPHRDHCNVDTVWLELTYTP